MSMYRKIIEFYDTMSFGRPVRPTAMGANRRSQLMMYIVKEMLEFGHAVELVDQVDALTDALYFILDGFIEVGIDPEVPFALVHEANMSKLHSNGKVKIDYSLVPPRMIKPEGWESPEPKIAKYIEELKKG